MQIILENSYNHDHEKKNWNHNKSWIIEQNRNNGNKDEIKSLQSSAQPRINHSSQAFLLCLLLPNFAQSIQQFFSCQKKRRKGGLYRQGRAGNHNRVKRGPSTFHPASSITWRTKSSTKSVGTTSRRFDQLSNQHQGWSATSRDYLQAGIDECHRGDGIEGSY